jgi:dTDP-4-amino-4,6-dideoxygalactose transaminase
MDRIAFGRAPVLGSELSVVEDAVRRGHLAGDGHYTALCSAELERATGSLKALLTPSCTAALEMATILAGVSDRDEVILPSFTFASVANAIVLRGGVPVFVDIRTDTLNIDEACVEAAITKRTRAIMVVHYAGIACEIDALRELAERHGLMLIEDAAHAIGSTYKDRPAGSLGHVGAFSFHETKNLTCGEGGALLINDPALIERAEIVREKGTNRSKFLRGEVDKYSWVDLGSSYLPSEINAAFLWEQLLHRKELLGRRVRRWERYHAAFEELERSGRARRPHVPRHASHTGHIYYMLLADGNERDRLKSHLEDRAIGSTAHYVPLHSSPAGRRFGRTVGDLANTDHVAAAILRLPMHDAVTDAQQDRVVAAVWDFFVAGNVAAAR